MALAQKFGSAAQHQKGRAKKIFCIFQCRSAFSERSKGFVAAYVIPLEGKTWITQDTLCHHLVRSLVPQGFVMACQNGLEIDREIGPTIGCQGVSCRALQA